MQLELTTPLYSLGEKLFVFVCRSTSSVVTPTCISWSPTGSILNLSIFSKGNLLLHCISPSTWGNQRGELPLCIMAQYSLQECDAPKIESCTVIIHARYTIEIRDS